jgi:hypothetical protein
MMFPEKVIDVKLEICWSHALLKNGEDVEMIQMPSRELAFGC